MTFLASNAASIRDAVARITGVNSSQVIVDGSVTITGLLDVGDIRDVFYAIEDPSIAWTVEVTSWTAPTVSVTFTITYVDLQSNATASSAALGSALSAPGGAVLGPTQYMAPPPSPNPPSPPNPSPPPAIDGAINGGFEALRGFPGLLYDLPAAVCGGTVDGWVLSGS